MKNIITWILSFAFLIEGICCNEELLSKFHQNGFKVKDARLQLLDYDKDVYNVFEIKIFKYNRTTTAHNITLNHKKDVKDDVEVLIQAYKFLSNEYRHFPVRFQVNLKKAVDANIIGLANMQKCGNLSSFYFCKDIPYHACNFVIDEKHLPPLIPNGKYKINVTLLFFSKEVAWLSLFGEIYTPIVYPKK